MKKLIFKDGVKAFFTDNSSIYDMLAIFPKFGDIDDLVGEFTKENLNGGTFDDVQIENIVPVCIKAEKNGDNVSVRFLSRNKTKDEILQEKIDELDKMLAKIKGQV